MPNINIDDAYILGETGAQVDKVTGLFTKDEDTTSGEKAFAQLNIGTAGSNRNLLDNGWFTVRQRGDGPFTGTVYTFDRWRKQGATATVSYSNGFISMTVTGSGWNHLQQSLPSELESALEGKTVTVSVLLPDGTVLSNTGTYPTTKSTAVFLTVPLSVSNATALVEVQRNASGNDTFGLSMNGSNGASASIKAFKLELGSVSTLANDVPQTGNRELEDCRFYFKRIAIANASFLLGLGYVNTNGTTVTFPNANKNMYKNPTVSYSGGLYVRKVGTEANHTFTGMSAAQNSHCVTLACTGVSGLSAGDIVYIVGTATGYIDLSADL